MSDPRGEQRVVDLLAVPLESYDVVTVSVLDSESWCLVWYACTVELRGRGGVIEVCFESHRWLRCCQCLLLTRIANPPC